MAASRVSPGTLPHPSRREQTQREASRRVTYLAELCTWSPLGSFLREYFSPCTRRAYETNREWQQQESPTSQRLRGRRLSDHSDPPKKTNDAVVSRSPSSLKNTVGGAKHSDQEAPASTCWSYNEKGQICLSSRVTNNFAAVSLGSRHSGGERAMAESS